LVVGGQIQRLKKSNEHDVITTVGKHWFGKGDRWLMVVGTYRIFVHPMSMITTVGKYLLGNGDKW